MMPAEDEAYNSAAGGLSVPPVLTNAFLSSWETSGHKSQPHLHLHNVVYLLPAFER